MTLRYSLHKLTKESQTVWIRLWRLSPPRISCPTGPLLQAKEASLALQTKWRAERISQMRKLPGIGQANPIPDLVLWAGLVGQLEVVWIKADLSVAARPRVEHWGLYQDEDQVNKAEKEEMDRVADKMSTFDKSSWRTGHSSILTTQRKELGKQQRTLIFQMDHFLKDSKASKNRATTLPQTQIRPISVQSAEVCASSNTLCKQTQRHQTHYQAQEAIPNFKSRSSLHTIDVTCQRM